MAIHIWPLRLPNARINYLQPIPLLRRLLGDHICFSLLLPGTYDLAKVDEAIALFSEGCIHSPCRPQIVVQ